MAGSKSQVLRFVGLMLARKIGFEIEDRLGECCYPPEFRGNLAPSHGKVAVTGLDPVTHLLRKVALSKMDGYAGRACV
jgi:hypothetical protein